jgi:restriction system protein
MAVPDFQSFFRPMLEFLSDGKEHTIAEARQALAVSMGMSESDLRDLLPSGIQTKFDNRVAWAKSYLKQAAAVDFPRRGSFKITDRGRKLVADYPGRIGVKILNQFPEFLAFHAPRSQRADNDREVAQDVAETPEESLQEAYNSIRDSLASDLMERITKNSSAFFESLVVDLMLALGYGGSRAEAGKTIGQSGDEGIDGIINEDKLGLDIIYLQAKRWTTTSVGRPELQKFVGALHGKRAKKGVFITTGKFTDDARRYVENIDPKVILIDGVTLAGLMIDHDLGVSTSARYDVKKIDNDYFEDA